MRISSNAPQWARDYARQVEARFNRVEPVQLPRYFSANLPNAAQYQDCAIINATLNIVCVSDGTDWIRQDTGAAV